MSEILRGASAQWEGDLRGGSGRLTSDSGVLNGTPYTFQMRFESAPGTNPEELVAAAHAGCYTMNLSGTLGRKGFKPVDIQTRAVVTLSGPREGGRRIIRIRLECRAKVEGGIDAATFAEIAKEAEATCPISNALRAVETIELDAQLV
jgi:osmotically inducible protein OsmC